MSSQEEGEGGQKPVVNASAHVPTGIDADGRHGQAADQVPFRREAHTFLALGEAGLQETCCRHNWAKTLI
jgi:hypothetical protein